MAYQRYDENNVLEVPQPTGVPVSWFSGTEGWSTINYTDWNGDYVAHDDDNNPRVVGTYQAYDDDNNPRVPGTYQRYDINNNPVIA